MGRLGIFVIFAIFSVGVAQEFRLPRNILPTSYKLEIISVLDEIPQFPRFSAPGKVWIRFDCVEATDVIKLHVLDLDINEGGIYVRRISHILIIFWSNFGIFFKKKVLQSLPPKVSDLKKSCQFFFTEIGLQFWLQQAPKFSQICLKF